MERGGGGGEQVQQGFDESARAGRGDFSEESDVTLILAIAKRACFLGHSLDVIIFPGLRASKLEQETIIFFLVPLNPFLEE
jgi:hypothetical protein